MGGSSPGGSAGAGPTFTVIALCFNHSAFLAECLDSIARQTCQDFQLIVTDDASSDDSADRIAAWLAVHRPDAKFVRHAHNRGLCTTLNEALALANGQFIAMVAMDDRWHAHRLAVHARHLQTSTAAVVYSDAAVIGEDGAQLHASFIHMHKGAEWQPPTSSYFNALADQNFIPAMCATIRLDALSTAGGYDERLTYEDYDMWLRLAAGGAGFEFVPATLADYRIVGTSIVRTLFARPNARQHVSQLLICRKWVASGLLSPQQTTRWLQKLAEAAYGLSAVDDARGARSLVYAGWRLRRPKLVMLGLMNAVGIKQSHVKQALRRP